MLRWILAVLLAVGGLTAGAFAQQPSGPFGLGKGMTQEQVIQIVGKAAIKESKGDTIRFHTVPRPHAAFEFYSLIFSPKSGLLKIVAYGKDIRTNVFGESVHDAYGEIRDAISRTYGQPTDTLDFLRAGSILARA